MKNEFSSRGAFTLIEIMIVVAIIGLLAAVAIPNFVKARKTAQQKACIKNLQQIDGAKEQWALEKKKSAGVDPPGSEIDEYIKGGAPKCPSGGGYRYNPVDTNPSCSIEGHSI